MEIKLYIILILYFLAGGIAMFFVNKSKDTEFRRNNWLKYGVYFFLVNLFFISILVDTIFFHYICIAILALGFYELFKITGDTRDKPARIVAFGVLILFSFACYYFSLMPGKYLFYTLYITTVFDAFSQLTGQLLGRKRLFPRISPNKTAEGLAGGLFFSLLTSLFIRELLGIGLAASIFLGLGMAGFAFVGDILASYCKRQFGKKDFSDLIPGHGGVLDRFDSLIAAGSFMFLIQMITQI